MNRTESKVISDPALLTHINYLTANLKKFALWRDKNDSRSFKLRGILSVTFCLSFNIILPIFNFHNSKKFHEDAMSSLFILSSPTLKVIIFYVRMNEMAKLLNNMEELLHFTESKSNVKREELRKHVRFMSRMLKIFLGTILFAIIKDLSIPFFDKRLPYKTWIPYNHPISDVTLLWFLSTLQILIFFVATLIMISIEMFPIFCMGTASKLLEELSNRLKLLSESQTQDEENYKELVQCVEVHLRIIAFVKDIEKNFSTMFFIQGFMSAAYICLTMYMLSTASILV